MPQNTHIPGDWTLENYTNVETARFTLTEPFNEDRVAELVNLQFDIPPVAFVGVGPEDDVLYVGLPNPVTQQEIDDAMTKLIAVCNDPTRNEQTQAQIFANYIALNLQYKDVFANASYVLETGIALLVTPSVAAYRAILTDTVQALAPLVGTSFETHFNRERTAQGLPPTIPISSMTLAQCAEFDELIHIWLNARKLDALIAESQQEEEN